MKEVTNFILMRGKFHFTINYRFPSSPPPTSVALGCEVEVGVLGWEDRVGERRLTTQGDLGRGPLWASCFTCSHMSSPFRRVLMASIYGRGNLGRGKFKDLPHTASEF